MIFDTLWYYLLMLSEVISHWHGHNETLLITKVLSPLLLYWVCVVILGYVVMFGYVWIALGGANMKLYFKAIPLLNYIHHLPLSNRK